MSLDAKKSDLTIGVVGAGPMGRGIAQIAVAAGIRTVLMDTVQATTEDARKFVISMIERAAEKGAMTKEAAAKSIGLLEPSNSIDSLKGCDVVIEAIVENLDIKKKLFQDLEALVSQDCIIATNTSSLSVTTVAAACKNPGRVAGFHFFNPVPLMKVVEVIAGVRTEGWVLDALSTLAERCGHTPVRAVNSPGFLVNHAGRAFVTEGLRVVSEGIADTAAVDRIMTEAAAFRLGPFQLLDLTGLDVSHTVMESIYQQFYDEPRFRPVPLTRRRVDAGLYGRKNGRGFYAYPEGKMEMPSEPKAPAARPTKVWVSPVDPEAQEKLLGLLHKLGATIVQDRQPPQDALILVTPFGSDTTTTAIAGGFDPARTVAVDCLTDLAKRRTIMTTPATDPAFRDAAHGLLAGDGVAVTVIADSAGFVAQRVLAAIVNVGCDIAQQKIAAPKDIDRAVTLGLGYPRGPLAFGDHYGPKRILQILEHMQAFYGDPRYRPSPWLKRRAALGLSLLTEGN